MRQQRNKSEYIFTNQKTDIISETYLSTNKLFIVMLTLTQQNVDQQKLPEDFGAAKSISRELSFDPSPTIV